MGRLWEPDGIRIKVISTGKWLYYSGAVPQYMGGFYEADQTRIDIEALCRNYGTRFVQGDVTRVDPDQTCVFTSRGEKHGFDYLVINTGVVSRISDDSAPELFPVKPMEKLTGLRRLLECGKVRTLQIQGGGPAGTELALNLSHPKSRFRLHIELVEKQPRLLESFGRNASDYAQKTLRERGVVLRLNETATDRPAKFDAVIYAVGNKPSSQKTEHPFEQDESGRIITKETLQVPGYESVFAAGDTARVGDQGYPQTGVHAVKQGVQLRENLKALHTGKSLCRYRPYSVNPLIISDGPDAAMLVAGSITLSGRWPIILKYMLDMNWLEKYTRPPQQRSSWMSLLREGKKRSRRTEFPGREHSTGKLID